MLLALVALNSLSDLACPERGCFRCWFGFFSYMVGFWRSRTVPYHTQPRSLDWGLTIVEMRKCFERLRIL